MTGGLRLMAIGVVLLNLLSFCTLKTKFWEFKDEANWHVVDKSSDFEGENFGFRLSKLAISASSVMPSGSYVAVSGSPTSQIAVYLFPDEKKPISPSLYFIFPVEKSEGFYDSGLGVSILGVERWSDSQGCFIVGKPGAGELEIFCLSNMTGGEVIPLHHSGDGTSVAVIPASDRRDVEGIAIGGKGRVYYMLYSDVPDASVKELFIRDELVAGLQSRALFVSAGLSGENSSSIKSFIAGGAGGRVFVFSWFDDTQSEKISESGFYLTDCFDISDQGGPDGMVMKMVDIDGDGNDEIFASTADVGSVDALIGGAVAVISGRRVALLHERFLSLLSSTGLEPQDLPQGCENISGKVEDEYGNSIAFVECADDDENGIECGQRDGFGTSFDIFDVDGDDTAELVVGSPGVSVEGNLSAGAVYLFDFNNETFDFSFFKALRIAEPGEGDELGYSVSVLSNSKGLCVIATQPGRSKMLLFDYSG